MRIRPLEANKLREKQQIPAHDNGHLHVVTAMHAVLFAYLKSSLAVSMLRLATNPGRRLAQAVPDVIIISFFQGAEHATKGGDDGLNGQSGLSWLYRGLHSRYMSAAEA